MMKVSYAKLDHSTRINIAKRLTLRHRTFINAISNKIRNTDRVLIVGDRPGPGAPTDPSYHHTPFYSTKHCSGWLNACLEVEGIPEDLLVWINAYDREGNPLDYKCVELMAPDVIIALGGNAEKWLKKGGFHFIKVAHPQFHKRFHSSERYELLDVLHPLKSAEHVTD